MMTAMQNRRIFVLGLICFLLTAGLSEIALGRDDFSPTPVPVPYYAPPSRMDLCGEPVPLQNLDVWERFDREFTIVVYSNAQVYLWLKRQERYFPWLEKQLAAQGLPDDLKYVAVAESDLQINACSPAGAVGPWQFIPSTGRMFGLAQSCDLDQRQDFEKATLSALSYLRKLHGMFQKWSLAIAAYNCGEGRIANEVKRQKVNNYYSLKLPLETERYVFRILAIKEVLSNPERYGYHLPKGAGYPELPVDQVRVHLASAVPIQPVAAAVDMTFREFKWLNPAFVSDTIPAGTHIIKVHKGKGRELENRLAAIKTTYTPPPKAKVEPRVSHHKVVKGDTLTSIANKYKVGVEDLRKWNNLKGSTVRLGQVLKIMK